MTKSARNFELKEYMENLE